MAEECARIRGPYNRRNVFGAALAYGPVLASDENGREMLRAVLDHGLTGEAPLYTPDSLATLSTNKVMSHAKASRELFYKPRLFRESMQDSIDFYSALNQIDTKHN